MRVLCLSYWVYDDALTTATLLPHLRILEQRPDVEAIRLVTVERGENPTLELPFASAKITFTPLLASTSKSILLKKTDDFLHFPDKLAEIARRFKPDVLIARGVLAGALAYLVWKKIKLPFYVESFEPHADYMRESGVWRTFDPRYLFLQYWENKQKRHAIGLMTVAENYRRQLLAEGIPAERVVTVPCSVDAQAFAFDPRARHRIRQRLDYTAPDALVGIYVGKFGDIYYDKEAFDLFRATADYFGPAFRLIVLTPQPEAEIRAKLAAVGLGAGRSFVTKVPHAEVADYLSAADFAFAPIRPAPCRLFCSAIKIGEYWASGLPVLLTPGVGDDSAIIEREGGGAIFDVTVPGSVAAALTRIRVQLAMPGYRAGIRDLALRYRSPDRVREAYAALLPTQRNRTMGD